MTGGWLPAMLLLAAGLLPVALALILRARALGRWHRNLVPFQLRLPRGMSVAQLASGFGMLGQLTAGRTVWDVSAVVVEIEVSPAGIVHRLLIPEHLVRPVLCQLRAVWPGVRLERLDNQAVPKAELVSEVRLTTHQAPLAAERAEAAVHALLGSLQQPVHQERVYLQWLLRGSRWPTVLRRSPAQPVAEQRRKRAHLPLQLVGRIGIAGTTALRSRRRAILAALSHLNANGSRVVPRRLPQWLMRRRLRDRQQPIGVWPVVVNATEAVGLLGLPVGTLSVAGLPLPAARSVSPPLGLPTRGGVVLGVSGQNGRQRGVRLSNLDRLHHLHVLGPTGTGKSTLLGRMVLQDAEAGHGVIVLDPKGGLAGDLLPRLPEHRFEDVVVLDPTDAARPVGWNPLWLGESDIARELAAEQLLHTLRSLWRDFWGPRTDEVMRSVLLTLTSSRPSVGGHYTLLEAPELLTNPTFRRGVLVQPGLPPHLRRFWQRYDAISEAERLHITGPVLNKLTAFTTRSPLRRVLGQSEGINLGNVVREGRIVLLRAEAGALGGEVAYLLGSLFLTSLWQAIQGRARLPWRQRRPLFVYIDELAQVMRLSVALPDLLAQARGLGVGLTLAHQYLQGQLNPDLRHGLLGTVRSRVLFQLGLEDARALEATVAPSFGADDLRYLPAHETVTSLSVQGRTLPAFTMQTLDWPELPADARARARRLQRLSAERWGRRLSDVDEAIEQRLGASNRPAEIGRKPRGETS